MPAYLLALVDVRDPELYRRYTEATPAVIAKFGGRFLVRGGPFTMLEGSPEHRRVVVIEFPSKRDAQNFYYSAEYQAVKELRAGAATGQFLVLDGV